MTERTNGSDLSSRVAEAIAERRKRCAEDERYLSGYKLIREWNLGELARERAYLDALAAIAGWHKPAWDGGQLCGECEIGWPCPTFAEVAAALGITEQEQV